MKSSFWISASTALLVLSCCGQKKTAVSEGGKTPTVTEAPQHNAPDQDRIDSLKQEKGKGK